ncbi:gliding motility-associated peptidyl-prolyl isomerase GldI [Flavobacteriaceae bacterium AH-315-B10]|nr:gliding motility-associated peptidyl-prolyl isomerase GldI [Flavobacteriaceae bacterium AH-315-B10]
MKKLITILLVMLAFTSCNSPEARRPVSVKTGSYIDKSVALNKKLNSEQHKSIQQIIKNNPDTEFIASQNGFWYYYNVKVEGDSITPKFGDIVNFNYNVTDFNNNTIYTEEELKARNYAMDQEELFSGLREGLKLMKAGETITFLFPSDKAYGYYGDENKIGTNIPIICKVTINTIIQKETN